MLKKNNATQVVPDEVLLAAAQLAKTYSAKQTGAKMPIIYTLCKYVKKANCKGLAFVTYKNEKKKYIASSIFIKLNINCKRTIDVAIVTKLTAHK